MARFLITAGALLVIAGLILLLCQRLGLPFGRLPGDFSWRGRRVTVFAPLGTSLLLSVLLSLLLYVLSRLRR